MNTSRAQRHGGEAETTSAGDTERIEAAEWHWNGAALGGAEIQLAIEERPQDGRTRR